MASFSQPALKIFASGGFLSGVRLLCGLARVKILALFLGPEGMGILSQANNFFLWSVALASLSLSAGVINRLREPGRQGNAALTRATLGTSFLLILGTTFLLLTLFLLAQTFFLHELFHDYLSLTLLLPVLLAIPIGAATQGYIQGLFFAYDRYGRYVVATCFACLVEVLLYYFLVQRAGLQGALLTILLFQSLLLLSYLLQLRLIGLQLSSLFPFHWDREEAKFLLRFSALMTYTASMSYGVVLFLRGQVLQSAGAAANGILQVPLALSAYGMPFLTNGIWGYLHPQASGTLDPARRQTILQETLRIVIPAAAAYAVAAMCLAPFFVPLFYTKDFLAANLLFPWQFSADFFQLLFFALTVYALSLGHLKRYFWGWTLYFGLYFFLTLWFLPLYGIRALPMANLCASASGLCALLMARDYRGWGKQNLLFFLLGMAAVALTFFLHTAP